MACLIGGLAGLPSLARGESINSSDFKIDIASNMAWIGNNQPAVGLKLWRQTAMEQSVLASRPYVRVTNNSAGGQIQNFQLDLRHRDATQVTGVMFESGEQASSWKWIDAANTTNINFSKPIDSGDSFTIRVATGPRSGGANTYSLQQNFFAQGQPIFSEQRSSGMSGFGVLGVTVYDPTRAAQSPMAALASPLAAVTSGPVNAIDQFRYSLADVVVDPYKTYGQQVGITITPVPVPEPSTLALLAAAVCGGGVAGWWRRRGSRRA